MQSLDHWLFRAARERISDVIQDLHTEARGEINRWAVKAEQQRLLIHDLKDSIRVLETIQASPNRRLADRNSP